MTRTSPRGGMTLRPDGDTLRWMRTARAWQAAARAQGDALRTLLVRLDRGPSWLAARPSWLRWTVGVGLGAAVLVAYSVCAQLSAWAHPGIGAWAAVVGLAEVVPLALLVRFPLLAWRLGWLAALLTPFAPGRPWGNWAWDPPQIPLLAAAYIVVVLRHGRRVRWTAWALMLVALWVWVPDPLDSVGGSLAFTAVTLVLDGLAASRRTRRALAEQTERARREQARRAVLEERARIARELHDVVAHHMSLIAVRAETAPYRHEGVREPLATEFAAIGTAARGALTDMRRLLGVLRSEEPAEPARAPQPGLADLPALIDASRVVGMPVDAELPGTDDVGGVPASVGLCAYRVVQESLSNAGRHAVGAAVTVLVRRDPARLLVRVTNAAPPAGPHANGRPPRQHSDRSAGHGITGMRERVGLLGGSLSAGPDGAGGFVVEASFPLAVREVVP